MKNNKKPNKKELQELLKRMQPLKEKTKPTKKEIPKKGLEGLLKRMQP